MLVNGGMKSDISSDHLRVQIVVAPVVAQLRRPVWESYNRDTTAALS